ncbi:receptor-type tyrosine-protein phosphatase H-like [Poeciliopsis prolifica]|uniref:receptor-type tyrosine-protein phosphatase H-like n=1 Tax=Poeciliopsis prolifica TaxID=188132 RepID=UPI00241376A8|nr:receptor-type tyrosine-protein phosphatase H-like [Poeciliopsis prolifica]XP_054907142.1 receptor-type tyrosine-protein phosphatase H-like [Poeciliopsis prolifica]
MDYRLLLLVFTGTLFRVSLAQTRQYYFVNTTLNWTDAQSLCRRDYTDLATIESTADVEAVDRTTEDYTGLAWIGLYDELVNSWKWSLNDSSFYGDEEETFRNWFSGQPNNLNGKQHCVILLSGSPYSGKWDDQECEEAREFVCYNGTANGSPVYILINESLSWTSAQAFCKENYVDLASVRNQSENDIISNLGRGSFLWIGLYREKLWSDGSTSLFQNWALGQPNHGGEECIATYFNESGKWHDQDCSLSYPFICYKPIPPNPGGFRASTQDESSITLQWNKINNNTSFILQFNGTETNISAPDGDGPVNYTVSSLTAGTKYTFTLFSVLDGVRSSGVELTTATVPQNAEDLRLTAQFETNITLQWKKVNNNTNFILQFNGIEKFISAPGEDGSVTYTVSPLNPGTRFTFTLFSVIENIRSSGARLSAATVPEHPSNFRISLLYDTNITLQWDKGDNNTSFVLQINGSETNISAPDGVGPVFYTALSLTAATRYTFTLFSVFENLRSRGISITQVTAPERPTGFTVSAQNETSITLQWDKDNDNITFVLEVNGRFTAISAPGGNSLVTHTIPSLTAGTRYTFTLFSWLENTRSTAVQLTAVTAPQNPGNFRPSTQDETSITLQWDKISDFVSFILQFNGTETNIGAPSGNGSVSHTVSFLTAGSRYKFTLFSVFDNVRSSGVNITASTGPSK